MHSSKLAENVYCVAAKIGTRDLFEGIWPIPNGVMLNSYVVQGKNKNVLVDLVKDWDGAEDQIESQMKELGLEVKDIDIVVINHMEPDHTGALNDFVAKNPNIEFLCSAKAKPLIEAFYNVSENVRVVADCETLDIGGKTLKFFMTPNIHWPETMMTYLVEDEILFSCDAFGAYGRFDHRFDDELTSEEEALLATELERYYANIVSSFSTFTLRGISKIDHMPLKIVAPSHGIVWRKDPVKVIEWYKRLATYMNGPQEKEITIVWSSMYGNTQAILQSFIDGVESEGLPVHVMQVPQTHESFVLEKVWRSAGIIVGMPTYEYKMFPPMYAILDQMERSHVSKRKIARFGSYGWSGGATKQFMPFIESMKLDFMGEVEYQGAPSQEDKDKAFELAAKMAKAIKEA
jgi:flavorubredoxin